MTGCALGALVMVASAALPLRPIVFGTARDWIILDAQGRPARRLNDFPAAIPDDVRDLAVSPDGKRAAVTAFLPSAENVMLFLWNLESGGVDLIGDSQGFHAAPTFSPDGSKLFFAHHPRKGGPPGMHQVGAYAQLWEQDLRTLRLTQLTQSAGCHMDSSLRGNRLYFAHANCLGGRRLEYFEDGVETPITELEAGHGEPSLSPDGTRLVATRDAGDQLEVVELRLAGKKPSETRVWRGQRVGTRFRPQYLADGQIAFQNGNKVYALKSGVAEELYVLGGGR